MSAFINYGPNKGAEENPEDRVFIQWKNTDACFDFYCDCGARGHFDGYFAYTVKCPECGQEWEMPSLLRPRKVCADTYEGHAPKLLDVDE